jgi:hypothetical protein
MELVFKKIERVCGNNYEIEKYEGYGKASNSTAIFGDHFIWVYFPRFVRRS